jgi:hypothetical protein
LDVLFLFPSGDNKILIFVTVEGWCIPCNLF